MAKYRKKPIIIEAEQFNPPQHIPEGVINVYSHPEGKYFVGEVTTIHGQRTTVVSGDWIIKEPKEGFYYPCKPDIFKENYEEVK